jgi:putative transposase
VRLVVSDDHEGIKAAVAAEMPGVERQRCTVHFECNVPSYVLASEVAEDLRAIFKVKGGKTARALAKDFVGFYGKRFPKAVSVFEAGIEDALSYRRYPEATMPAYARRTCSSGSLER